MQHMNAANESIKFTHEVSNSEITFLDVKDGTDTLQVKSYIKPTNKQLYIRHDLHHPPGTTKGIAICEATRFLRINSTKENFRKILFLLKKNFLRRGYPKSIIREMLRKVKFSMRTENSNKRRSQKRIPRFHPPSLADIVAEQSEDTGPKWRKWTQTHTRLENSSQKTDPDYHTGPILI